MKFATWNVNSLNVRLPQVIDWLAVQKPDVLALQETKITDDKFPHEAFTQVGYQSACYGQKTYNGVALISRVKLTDVVFGNPEFEDPQTRLISATANGVRLIGAYFPNGQAPDTEKYGYKMNWLKALEGWLSRELKVHTKLLLGGDFNIAPTDDDVYDPSLWRNQILCTPEEREHFQKLLALGMVDAFRLFEQLPKSWTWWDYRGLTFRKNQGLRIDHILASDALKANVTACSIDKQPRKNERPSDHAPVIVEFSA